ncbi:MAG: glycosyltransferase family 2 protein [Cyclobacteriaceae bacterium]
MKQSNSKHHLESQWTCSVICPAYNESENLFKLVETIENEINGSRYEIIIVDDGSDDNTLSVLENLIKKYPHLKYVSFTRNFGHQNALMAGIRLAKGSCVVMLDADMQHPPSLIPDMITKWKAGYKVVQAVRQKNSRGFKHLSSKLFYRLISMLSDVPIVEGTSDFRLIDKEIVNHLKELDRPVFLRGYIPWLGYKTQFLNYIPNRRNSGKTKFSFQKMVKLSLDGITTQSTFPLRLSRYIGTIVSVLAFLYLLYAIYVHVFTTETVQGWTSILISILFLGGVQLIFLGVLGEYIGRIFERSYRKPIYQIKKQGGNEENSQI